MNSMVLILVIALLAIAVLGIALGLVFSSRRKAPVVEAPPTVEPVETPEAPVVEPAVPALEKPEGRESRLVRLRQRLAGSQGGLGKGLLALLSRDRLDEDTWESIEDTLLTADVGVAPTQELVEKLRNRLRVEGTEGVDVRAVLREELLALVDPDMDRRLRVSGADGVPGVV